MNRLFTLTSLLVLPLALLLFAQWPLRDGVQAGSREANDLAQLLFAVYGAAAVTAASRHGAHLAAPGRAWLPPRWRAWALRLCVVPWAGFVLWASGGEVAGALMRLEHFPDTMNPGYFVIKLSVWLLAGLVLLDALWPRREAPP